MATKLTDASIDHLALVFASKDGVEFAPRNREARFLGVKAGEVESTPQAKASLLNSVVEMAKKALGQWPVSSDVPDGVDGDDDGAEDYNQIVGCVCSLSNDLQGAFCINDDDARSFAIKVAIDNFLKSLDDIRSGGDGVRKAGKRHSAADQAKIDAVGAAHEKMGKAIEAMQKAHAAMGENLDGLKPQADSADATDGDGEDDAEKAQAVKALAEFTPGEVGEDGYPVNYSEYVELCQKAKKDDKRPYGDVEYADPKNGKYPIDTKEHAKAAWSYINMPKNAKFYSAEELAEVKARIKAACKKFGVEISEDDNKAAPADAAPAVSTDEVEMTKDELAALVTEAATKAAESVKAELQPQIDAANERADKAEADAKAAAEKAEAEAESASQQAEAAKAAQKAAEDALNAAARKPSGRGEVKAKAGESGLVRALKAANAGTPITMQGRDAA